MLAISLTLIAMILVIERPPVFLPFIYTIILFLVISFMVDPGSHYLSKNFVVFLAYLGLTLLLYKIHKTVLPDFYGFSGPFGIGTDDLGFFYNASNHPMYKPPEGYRIFDHLHPFSRFLRILYPFSINHPLSLIIPNVLGITFIPLFTQRIADHLTNDKKAANLAFILTSVCPIILANGLILVRDGWVTLFFIIGLYSLLSKRYIPLVGCLLIMGFLRLSSALLLVISLILYLTHLARNEEKGAVVSFVNYLGFITIGIMVLILMLPGIQFYLESKTGH